MQAAEKLIEKRARLADEQDRIADERDRVADERERIADERERLGDRTGESHRAPIALGFRRASRLSPLREMPARGKMSVTLRKFCLALAAGAIVSFLIFFRVGDAMAAENAGCPTGSLAWFADSLPFGPDVDINGDNIICEFTVSGHSEWVDNTTVNERVGSCPTNARLELHPGFVSDRNGDNYLCFLVTGAAHTRLGKEIFVDNNRTEPIPG
jgi:hypothetical protein